MSGDAVLDKAATITSESRNFRMHPALLWSVIQAQAGTAEKALLEAIMNAVDAGATRCDITLDERGYRVEDDGSGFRNRNEIEQFFETFGTPHVDGDATYGRFRMGRGQLFAFSRTLWRSATFSMDVDIKHRGLSYDLCGDLPEVPGCAITGQWYEPIDLGEAIRIRHDLAQLAQWMQITVRINGKQVNKRPDEQAWTLETPDAYIAAKAAGGLAVYNLGALVRIYPPHQFGLSGIIVTKSCLQVNFARNDILVSKCEVWRRIRRELEVLCGTLVKKRSLMDHERDAMALRFVRGQLGYAEINGLGLLVDASGRKRSLRELAAAERVCVVPSQQQWQIGERVMQQELAFVVRTQSLDRFGVETLEELLALLRRYTNIQPQDCVDLEQIRAKRSELWVRQNELGRRKDSREGREFSVIWKEIHELECKEAEIIDRYPYRGMFDHIKVVTLVDVAGHINDRYDLILKADLMPHQLALLDAMQSASEWISRQLGRRRYFLTPAEHRDRDPNEAHRSLRKRAHRRAHEVAQRKIMIGKSDTAEAWTDGETYIAINDQMVNEVLNGKRTALSLASLLYHEYCHDASDVGGHLHSPDFYETFHELACCRDSFDRARQILLEGYANAIADQGKKPNAHMMRRLKNQKRQSSAV